MQLWGNKSLSLLETGIARSHTFIGYGGDLPFGDLRVQIAIPHAYAHFSTTGGEGDKYFVGPETIRKRGKNFTVYGFGTAGDVIFENCKYNQLATSCPFKPLE